MNIFMCVMYILLIWLSILVSADVNFSSEVTINTFYHIILSVNVFDIGKSLTLQKVLPLVMNGLSHPYYLDEFIFIRVHFHFRGVKSKFSFLYQFR